MPVILCDGRREASLGRLLAKDLPPGWVIPTACEERPRPNAARPFPVWVWTSPSFSWVRSRAACSAIGGRLLCGTWARLHRKRLKPVDPPAVPLRAREGWNYGRGGWPMARCDWVWEGGQAGLAWRSCVLFGKPALHPKPIHTRDGGTGLAAG